MPDPSDPSVVPESNVAEPKPDPWIPPRANAAQAASIATGATGVALLAGSESSGTAEGMIALLPDPHRAVAAAAHLLGIQLDASSSWTWGFLLVVLSVALNIYSFAVRYRWARAVEDEYADRVDRGKA
ncbi:MAG TPA: hypothetical protein DD490_18775 [Acidobacteria bacterium]|nr:hypothetical protein [Acidobacteriota bacterium]